MTASPRELARSALAAVDNDGVFVSEALNVRFGPSVDRRDRALATEIVYGVLRFRERIDRTLDARIARGLERTDPMVRRVLRVGTYQLLFLDRVPAHAVVNDAVNAVRRRKGPRVAGFVNGVLRGIAREGEPALPELEPSNPASVALHNCLPLAFVNAVFARAGDDAAAACRGFSTRPTLWGRCNRRRTTANALAETLTAEGAGILRTVGDAVEVDVGGSPADSPSFQDGMWTVQDLGAQLCAVALAPSAGMKVLDACAGVGGKTSHLLELADVEVDAVDTSQHRLDAMKATCERLGLAGVRAVVADLTEDVPELEDAYDAVLLDAPCSGWGVLRRHPEQKLRARDTDPRERASLQRRLLDRVAARVKPGGVLVYSVCTFTREEGPEQIRKWLADNPAFELSNWRAPDGFEPQDGQLSTWPHLHGCDAFYIARMRRVP